MIRAWIKSKMPRSLFGRAMLILAVPVVVIQIVVAAYFAERLFRDVSLQLSENIALDVNYVASFAQNAPDKSTALKDMRTAARPLRLFISYLPDTVQAEDKWGRFDLSGYYVAKALKTNVNNILNVDLLSNRDFVQLAVKTQYGRVRFSLARTRASANNPHQLLVAMLFTALVFTGISVLFLNNQIKPIKRLSDAAEAFGRGWAIPFSPRGAREVRSAGHSFLAMRTRIIRQIEQRTMMLSGVSHDLRTPLTRMKLSLGLLEPSEEVEHLKRDVDEMEMMLTEFLEFARGDSEEKTETVDINSLAKRIVGNFKRAGHRIELLPSTTSPDADTIKCREQAVQRAIENLLGNAVRYGKNARLSVTSHTNNVIFTIEDDGPGIPVEKRAAALEPFTRLDEARNQDKGVGSGLGLAIATDVARSHGGKLELSQSTDMGGLKAVLTLPR
jgi:two-component system, OmpR family, osmolarity sensor histidine kinase EnvZ